MKKRIISLLTVVCLLMASVSVVGANTKQVPDLKKELHADGTVKSEKMVKMRSLKGATPDYSDPDIERYSLDVPVCYTMKSYNEDNIVHTVNPNEAYVFTPTHNGWFNIVFVGTDSSTYNGLQIIDWTDGVYAENEATLDEKNKWYEIKKGHEYWINMAPYAEISAYFMVSIVPRLSTRTISSNGTTYIANAYSFDRSDRYVTSWKKYVGSKGRLAVTVKQNVLSTPGTEGKITLLNSNGTAVSPVSSIAQNGDVTYYYGVKGDTTYKIKISSASEIYAVKTTFSKYSGTPGTTKKKATSIKRGNSKKSVLPANGSTGAHWYKITLSNRGNFKMNIETYGAPGGSLQFTCYNSKGKQLKTLKLIGAKSNGKVGYISGTNVAKGTYYFKVSKNTKLSSGAYSLKFN